MCFFWIRYILVVLQCTHMGSQTTYISCAPPCGTETTLCTHYNIVIRDKFLLHENSAVPHIIHFVFEKGYLKWNYSKVQVQYLYGYLYSKIRVQYLYLYSTKYSKVRVRPPSGSPGGRAAQGPLAATYYNKLSVYFLELNIYYIRNCRALTSHLCGPCAYLVVHFG